MAAKKKSVKAATAKKKSLKAVEIPAAIPEKKPEAKNSRNIFIIIGIVVALVLTVEMVFVVKKQAMANKKPVLVANWDVKYGGQAGMPVSGNSLYVIDDKLNEVKKLDKMTGALSAVFPFESAPKWAGENSKGETFVILRGDPKVYVMKAGKKQAFISTDLKDPLNFSVDTKDNIVVSDAGASKIVKFDSNGTKVTEFGGRTSEKAGFIRLGRIFVDSSDNIYALETSSPLKVKVFNPEGKFIKEWKLPLKALFGVEALAVTNDGNVYINDWSEGNIKVFSNDGKPLGKFTHDIGMTYKIGMPGAFSGGPDNYIYVASNNIAVFEPIKY